MHEQVIDRSPVLTAAACQADPELKTAYLLPTTRIRRSACLLAHFVYHSDTLSKTTIASDCSAFSTVAMAIQQFSIISYDSCGADAIRNLICGVGVL